MFYMILITALACSVLASDELESVSGVRGGNRVTLCMDPGKAKDKCDGVIWERNWILTRGNCVADRAMYLVVILRTSVVACEIMTDMEVSGSRKVRARFLHPNYPETNFALVCLVKPYETLEPLRNESIDTLSKLEPWLTNTYNQYSTTTQRPRYNPDEKNMMFSSPVKMFMTTVVLPLTSFIVVFLYITFYTGSTKTSVSYQSLRNANDKVDSIFA